MCLGLPLVAWLALMQRQRVVAKHAVNDPDGESWVTAALYPCSLLQMHALMQQQEQQQCQAAAPYKAPKVQQMMAGEQLLGLPCLRKCCCASGINLSS
jgi:NADPH:quinone reductase-like Zn-dependent oxidoreductase